MLNPNGVVVRANGFCVRVFCVDGRWMATTPKNDVVPVTAWIDDEGDDCGPDEAVTCVAGDDDCGWVVIELAGDERLQ